MHADRSESTRVQNVQNVARKMIYYKTITLNYHENECMNNRFKRDRERSATIFNTFYTLVKQMTVFSRQTRNRDTHIIDKLLFRTNSHAEYLINKILIRPI